MAIKTALVTGDMGFIGRHMVRELRSRGFEVDGFDISRGKGGLGDVVGLFNNHMGWSGYSNHVYDLVVHCAYHVGGRAAIDGVNTNFAKNLQLDAGLFQWAVRTKQKRVLYFSSSAVYPVSEQSKWCADNYLDARLEEDSVDLGIELSLPDANYGWAKLTGERLAEDARRSGLNVSIVRPFSGYGEDQSLDYPFPSIINRARQGDLTVWGPPGQTRDWIYVIDLVRGALAVVESETEDPVNLCTGVGTEMGELAMKISVQAGFPDDCEDCQPVYDESKPTGVHYRVGDPTRMLQYYTPQVSLQEGIRRALS